MGVTDSIGGPMVFLSISVYIIVKAFETPSLFSWHPTCMTIGFGLFISFGVLAAKATKDVSRRRNLHALSMWFFMASAAAGFYAIWQNKELNDYPHYQSYHSWYGLTALALGGGVSLGGGSAYLAWMYRLMKPKTIQTYLGYHKLGGGLAAAAALAALISGYYTTWGENMLGVYQHVFGVLSIIAFGVVFTASR